MVTPHLSDSAEQRTAENFALEAIGRKLGVELLPRKLQLADGSCVEIDGGTEGPPTIFAEVYAHQGRLKGSQPTSFSPTPSSSSPPGSWRFRAGTPASCSCSLTTIPPGLRTGWRKAALAAMEVEVHVVALSPEIAASVRVAQKRQDMKNAAKMP
jgi:hypothetical protein